MGPLSLTTPAAEIVQVIEPAGGGVVPPALSSNEVTVIPPELLMVATTRTQPEPLPVSKKMPSQLPVRSACENVAAGATGVADTSLDSVLSPLALTAVTTK